MSDDLFPDLSDAEVVAEIDTTIGELEHSMGHVEAVLGITRDERADWLAWRRQGLGGSDIAAVLGMSPWTSRYALWADKAGLLPDDDDPTEAMEFGLRAEPMLAGYFSDRTGMIVDGAQEKCVHPDIPWARCTVDGKVYESIPSKDPIAVAEWKTTGDTADHWAEHGVPDHYATQATWTSIVTGIPVVWFGVLHLAFGRPQFRTYQFVPDAADKQLVLEAATSFWHDHVVAGVPPEVDGSDSTANALAAIHPEHIDGETVDLPEGTAVLLDSRVLCKADEKQLKERLAEIDNRIAAVIGDAEIGLIDGQPVVSYKAQTRTVTCKACQHETTSAPFRVLRTIKPKTQQKAA